MIEQQYIDDMSKYNDKTKKMVEYILNLSEYDKQITLLYMEYNSYRMVAEETNVSHVTITKDIKQIQELIRCII